MINPHVLHILQTIQSQPNGKAIVFGGYLRDILLNQKPKDVDICTNLSKDELLNLFPFASSRQSIRKHTIIYFSFKNLFFEIVTDVSDFRKKLQDSDLTINALGHDGKQWIDVSSGKEDIKNGILRYTSPDVFSRQLNENPLLYIRIIRIAANTNFQVEPKTFELFKKYGASLKQISTSIKINELYKILHAKYPLQALKLLSDLGHISPFSLNHDIPFDFNTTSRFSHRFTLVSLTLYSSFQTVQDFLNIMQCPNRLQKEFLTLYDAFQNNKDIQDFTLRNEIILLKNMFSK